MLSCCIAPAMFVLCMGLPACLSVRLLVCPQHAQISSCLPNHVCFLTDLSVLVSLSLSSLQPVSNSGYFFLIIFLLHLFFI